MSDDIARLLAESIAELPTEVDGNHEEWNARDAIVGFGSALGTARLAGLLLDIGNPPSSGDEYRLEGENGFLGVAPLSAEVAFWLPGSIGWDTRLGLG